ncbi:MAG TPA: hypothetical protein DCL48_00320 [Alphaproteobacteria bacterium]|nr:hypothetical protein [Alphaproteobacteria bacterium]
MRGIDDWGFMLTLVVAVGGAMMFTQPKAQVGQIASVRPAEELPVSATESYKLTVTAKRKPKNCRDLTNASPELIDYCSSVAGQQAVETLELVAPGLAVK